MWLMLLLATCQVGYLASQAGHSGYLASQVGSSSYLASQVGQAGYLASQEAAAAQPSSEWREPEFGIAPNLTRVQGGATSI